MWQFIIRRLLTSLPVLVGVVTISFMLMHLLPGDPAAVILAASGASPEQVAELRAELGLDDSLWVQYWRFVRGAVTGDFGESIWNHRPVMTVILEQLPRTLELAFAALLLSLAMGTFLGVIAAVFQNSWADRFFVAISALGISMPMFWSSLVLILIFAVKLHWLPATGQASLKHLILPTFVLGFACAGTVTRTVRSSMVEVLRQEYVTTARAKGLEERLVVIRHALRNALIPVVTLVGLQFGWLLGGTVIVETVFARQGLGHLLVDAILWKDFPLVQAGVLITAITYLALNLLVDVLYGFIDPRLRLQ